MRFEHQCPFCSEREGNVVDGAHSDGYQVQCLCGARGPFCTTKTEAIEAWNSGVRNLQVGHEDA